jgi:mitochondrial fission process protein 1
MWGKSPDKAPKEPKEAVVVEAKEVPKDRKAFDPDKLPEREKLPDGLQKLVDKADKNESFYDELLDG